MSNEDVFPEAPAAPVERVVPRPSAPAMRSGDLTDPAVRAKYTHPDGLYYQLFHRGPQRSAAEWIRRAEALQRELAGQARERSERQAGAR